MATKHIPAKTIQVCDACGYEDEHQDQMTLGASLSLHYAKGDKKMMIKTDLCDQCAGDLNTVINEALTKLRRK